MIRMLRAPARPVGTVPTGPGIPLAWWNPLTHVDPDRIVLHLDMSSAR